MKLSCIHTHTSFCDGDGTVEDFCRAALEKGFSSLGFSAHAPIQKKTGLPSAWTLQEEQLPRYIEAVREAKRRWEGKLAVYLGLEVDFIPGLMGPADADYREMGLDYLIGSVHCVLPPQGGWFEVDGSPDIVEKGFLEGFGGDSDAFVNAYWDNVEALIRSGGFDLLGHPDLIKKNNSKSRFFSEDSAVYRRRAAAVAALAGRYGITAEVNTGGMNRKRINDPYPSLPLLRRFREHGVPMVINADAHCPEDLDGYYPEAVKTMLAAGYTETVLFEGRKDGLPLWSRERLGPC
ncbi:MAG: histidinol-phosphatase [Treponema sp.]|jgi:histidinol-phosphatase (PHP family)|nr:histidinol-phosphatase [Treponema sp.]